MRMLNGWVLILPDKVDARPGGLVVVSGPPRQRTGTVVVTAKDCLLVDVGDRVTYQTEWSEPQEFNGAQHVRVQEGKIVNIL